MCWATILVVKLVTLPPFFFDKKEHFNVDRTTVNVRIMMPYLMHIIFD